MVKQVPKPLGTLKPKIMEWVKITYRVSLNEKRLLQLRAKNCGLSLSAYSRQAVLGQKIRENLTGSELKAYKRLFRCQRAFVRLARDRGPDHPELAQAFGEMAALINEGIMDFKQ